MQDLIEGGFTISKGVCSFEKQYFDANGAAADGQVEGGLIYYTVNDGYDVTSYFDFEAGERAFLEAV